MPEYSERVATNVTEDFKRTIRVEAAKHDMTISEYVRTVLKDELCSEGNADSAAMLTTAD